MSCLHKNKIFYDGCTVYVHYYSSLFNGRIHSNIHLFIHVIQSLFFSLFFLCMLVRILSSNIYFLWFFLASFLIDLIYYFYSQMVWKFHNIFCQGPSDLFEASIGATSVKTPNFSRNLKFWNLHNINVNAVNKSLN